MEHILLRLVVAWSHSVGTNIVIVRVFDVDNSGVSLVLRFLPIMDRVSLQPRNHGGCHWKVSS